MMKNKIFAILISLSLVIFYGCASPTGGSDPAGPNTPTAPESQNDPNSQQDPGSSTDPNSQQNPGSSTDPESQNDPENPPAPVPPEPEKTAGITITVQPGSDFAVSKSENSGTVTLTCESGYSDFKWYVDGSSEVVSETESYSFTPQKGVTMVYVKAKKAGAEYSATYYVSK